jgi:predicted MFS family arabinose efflux permease
MMVQQVASTEARSKALFVTLLLTSLNVVSFADRIMIAVLVQPIKHDLHLSDTQMGLLSGFAFVAVYAAVGLPLARLADRIGRRWILAASVGFWSLMTAVCGLTQTFGQLVLARLGVGLGEAGCIPSGHALLADMYPRGKRTLPLAIFTMGSPIGIAVGLGVGGKIASLFGWRAAFFLVGLPGLALAILVLFTMPEPGRLSGNNDVREVSLWSTVTMLLRIRTYRRTVGAYIFYLFSTFGTLAWLPAFYMRTHGLNVAQVGLFFGIAYGLGAAVGCFVGGFVLQKVSEEQGGLFWGGCMMIAALPFFIGALVVPSTITSLVAIMLYGALMGAAGPPFLAGQQCVVDAKCRATASALAGLLSNYLGGGLGALLLGMVSDALTPSFGDTALRTALLIASAGIIVAAIFALRASRTLPADAKL